MTTDIEYESDGRTISSIPDEILNFYIPANIPGSDELEYVKQSHKSEATLNSEMGIQRHTRTKREGVLHSCEHCEYKTTDTSNLKRHTQS